MKVLALLVTSAVTCLTGLPAEYALTQPHLRFAAFNVRIFGQAKMKKSDITAHLVSVSTTIHYKLLAWTSAYQIIGGEKSVSYKLTKSNQFCSICANRFVYFYLSMVQ